MEDKLFVDVIRMICEMATIKFEKAIIETGYLDDLYKEEDYENIRLAIDSISQEFKE